MTNQSLNNLVSPALSRVKSLQNQEKILSFLLHEKFSTCTVLKEILCIKDTGSMRRILRRLESKNFIKKHVENGQITIWGITQQGVYEAQDSDESITQWSYFEPSKFNITTLNHHLEIQKIHIECIKNNIDITLGNQLGSRKEADKVPDAILRINGNNIALEVERHAKTKRRYEAVIYHYLKEIRDKKVAKVLYICPTKKKAEQIKKVIFSIEKLTMTSSARKEVLRIKPDVHLAFFEFISLDEFPSYLHELIAH